MATHATPFPSRISFSKLFDFSGSTVTTSPRRILGIALGLIWLLDAALQYQPYMFKKDFGQQIIIPAGQGSPHWISSAVNWSGTLASDHPVLWNAVFATVQLAIAVGILFPRRSIIRLALAGSIVWALMIWYLGEGLGGLFSGPISPLSGIPGAAVIYAVLAVMAWPSDADDNETQGRSLAFSSPLGPVASSVAWIALWGLFAFEALRPADRSPSSLHSMVIGMQDGEPAALRAFDRFAAHPLNHDGTEYSIVLAVLCILIGLGVFWRGTARPAIVVAVLLALVAVWAVGENFGEIATGQATDPNTGPLIALLAVAYWPRRQTQVQRGSSSV